MKNLRTLTQVFLLLMLTFALQPLRGQNPTYLCELRNDAQIDDKNFEFDIYLLRTGTTPFELAAIQFGIYVNASIVPATGVLSASFVAGTSELVPLQQPTAANISMANSSPNKTIKITGVGYPGAGSGTVISDVSPGTRYYRVRVTCTLPFVTSSQAGLAWSFANPPSWPTKVQAYVAGVPVNITTQASHTTTNLTNIILNPPTPPAAFAVTGGGSYCQGSGGLPVGLAGSETGVTYTLYKNGVAQVPTVPGTGSALSFGNQLAGTYTVKGTNGNGTTDMTGSAIIFENAATPVSVSILADANNICAGTTVNFTATPGNGGVNPTYQWYVNTTPVGTGLSTYSYAPANNDNVKVVMTSDLSGCLSGNPATSNIINMAVSIPGPAGVTVAPSANPSCGAASVTFTATPSNGGTPSYQWYLNGSPVGANQATYSVVPVTGDQVYVIMTSSLPCATGNPATSNTVTMTVDVPVPASVAISPSANPVCAGTSVTFTASPTNGGTPTYQWYKNTLPVGSNLATYTGTFANNDQVYVVMTSSLGCTSGSPATSATTTMTVNALPTPTLAGPASVCVNTTGNVYTTEVGFSNYVWTVSAGGSITSGGTATDNTVTVTWSTVGPKTVSVNYTNANSCTAVTPTVYNVTVNALPTPTITGPATVCNNSTGNVYTTQTGMTGYTWAVSAGGTITAGAGTNAITITWSSTGPQTVSVNYTNASLCTAASPTVYNVTVNPLPVPTVTGPASICVNSTGNVYTTESGMSNYVWTVSAGGTVTAGGTASSNTVTITWTTTGAKTVSVNYTNGSSCSAAAATVYNVTVNPLPVPTVTGPASACVNSTGNSYSTQAGMTGYVWTVSAGGTITAGAGTSAITVTWNTTGAQTVSVNYLNGTGCTAPTATVYNVTVNALPVPTVTGPTPVGVGTSQVYTTQAGMTGYVWTVSAGGTITAGAGTNSITVTWNTAGAQSVSVNYSNANSCSAATATVFPVSVISIPPPAGVITGTATVCQGATGVPYSVAPIPNATGYVWTLPTGATIASGANTNSITVDFSYSAVSGAITVYGTNTYGNGTPSPAFNVTVTPSPVPTITGENDLCQTSEYYYYVTEPGMTNYIWNMSPNSGTITWVTGSNQVMIFWTTPGAHWVSVTYTAPGGCAVAAPTVYPVTVHPVAGATGTITGSANVCAGATGVSYSVPAVANATSYAWTVPAGATIASGATTNSITVDFGTSAVSGDIVVSAVNDCGNGPASTPFAVTIDPVPADAGTITGPNSVCQGAQGVVYSVGAIANATGYTWTVPAGAAIVSGATTNSITVDFSFTASSGNVTVVGTNTCGSGAPSTFAVTLNPVPETPVITQDGNLLTSSATSGNQWYFNGTSIPGATGQTYEVVYIGNYYATVTQDGCSSDTSNNIYVVYVIGMDEHANLQKFEIYPNPNHGRFTLDITSSTVNLVDLKIMNNLGVSVYEHKGLQINGSVKEVIDLKNLPVGMYSVILNAPNMQVIRKMIVN